MKKNIFLSFLMTLFLCTACFEDDSTLSDGSVGEISIEGLARSYSVISYGGNKLEMQPTVQSPYTDAELDYTWSIILTDAEEYNPEIIGKEKNLSYEVNLLPGTYTLIMETKVRDNGYTVHAQATVTVTTDLSQGFYLLKETADGNTELDMYSIDGKTNHDLLAKSQGAALTGAPLGLSTCYDQCYIDTETDEMAHAHALCVTTKANEIKVLRSLDLFCMHDRSSILFDEMEPDEQVYTIQNGYINLTYLSNKGVRITGYYGSMSPQNTSGKFGMTKSEGASPFIIYDPMTMGHYFWDETSQMLYTVDFGGNAYPADMLPGYKCLACGNNAVSSMYFFLFEDASGMRWLHSYMYGMSMGGTPIDPTSHLAQADCFSMNGLSATLLYCIHNGKLYGYDTMMGVETEIIPSGIAEGTPLTYVSNQYWNSMWGNTDNNFDYLMVGTQNGNEYTLYMYNMIGGMPDGEPAHTVKGTGMLKSVRYISQDFTEWDMSMNQLYPTTD